MTDAEKLQTETLNRLHAEIEQHKAEKRQLAEHLAKAQQELVAKTHAHEAAHGALKVEHEQLKARLNPPAPETEWTDGEYYDQGEGAWKPCRIGATHNGFTRIEIAHRNVTRRDVSMGRVRVKP